MSVELSPDQKKDLRASSQPELEVAFGRVRRHFAQRVWLDPANRYVSRAVERLSSDAQQHCINNPDLAEYIAASAPLHCTDGWSYLGRALSCVARGDSDAARHLGYYAELRAAMSLLASEGIGIFNDRHFALNDNGVCQELQKRLKGGNRPIASTHLLTWFALEYWAGLRRSSNLLAEIIAPEGIPLREWMTAFNPAGSLLPVGRRWLDAWGLDLKRLAHDRNARNESSYRPTKLNSRPPLPVRASSSFLRALWEMSEPAGGSRFRNLDRHLLRESLKFVSPPAPEESTNATNEDFKRRVEAMLTDLSVSPDISPSLEQFLTRQVEPDTLAIIVRANGAASVGAPHHHLEVIARAALLLRVATGASSKLIRAHNIQSRDLEFWWRELGEGCGLWPIGQEITTLQDLWADAREAIDTVAEWESATKSDSQSFYAWNRDCAEAISALSGCESIGLWGLGI